MGGYDEFVDLILMMGEEGVDLLLVEEASALSLGEHEVGQDEEAEVGVEWEPRRQCSALSREGLSQMLTMRG